MVLGIMIAVCLPKKYVETCLYACYMSLVLLNYLFVKFFMVVIWGWKMMANDDLPLSGGENFGQNNTYASLSYLKILTVREMCLPLITYMLFAFKMASGEENARLF